MQRTLEKFGFGENFRKWIKIIYTNPLASIKINVFLTENINISRGVKQGCPLSALLFILGTEILSLKIKNDKNMKGLTLPLKGQSKSTYKLSQYADDMSLFLKNAEETMNALHSPCPRPSDFKINNTDTDLGIFYCHHSHKICMYIYNSLTK